MSIRSQFIKKTAIASAALTLAPALAFAGSNSNGKAAQLVTKLSQGQVKIIKQFNAIDNLKGFVIKPKSGSQQETIVYADQDGKYMVAGAVVTPDGTNLAQKDFQKYINSAIAPKVFASAQKANWIQQGSAKAPHKAYILIEPNCIACHMLYNELRPMIKSGQLAVRWIFVAFMKPQSEGMAAAIMQSKEPAKALFKDEKDYQKKTETGGIKPLPKDQIKDSTKKKLKANMQFMTKYHFVGTPIMTYKTQSGDYQVTRGFLPGKTLKDTVNKMSGSF